MIRLESVTKTWSENGVRACDAVSMTLGPGEVVALLGENGAGKSTLVSLLAGLQEPDEGRIEVDGAVLGRDLAPAASGIALVAQHPPLAPELTLFDNVLVGQSGAGWWKPGYRARWGAAMRDLASAWGFALDWSKRGRRASAVEAQRVALITQFLRGPRLLILDEPTAALPAPEAEALLRHLRDWTRQQGTTLLVITHKLDEALRWSDRIAVLRQGKLVRELLAAETNAQALGTLLFPAAEPTPWEPAAEPGQAIVLERRGTGTDFALREGEILGLTSLKGEGCEDLEEELSGFRGLDEGEYRLLGENVTGRGIGDLRERGLSYVPSDRLGRGSSPLSALASNLIPYRVRSLTRRGLLPRRSVRAWFQDVKSRYALAGEAGQRLVTLSGGNIQKVILAREIEHGPRVLILAEPAWGLDRAARALLWKLVRDTARRGTAVVVLSTDPLDLLEVCHRVGAVVGGVLREMRPSAEWRPDTLGRVLLGLDE